MATRVPWYTVGGTTTKYNWNAGWNLLNEEDGSGNLTGTFFHDPNKPIGTMLAHVDDTAPSTPAVAGLPTEPLPPTERSECLHNNPRDAGASTFSSLALSP